MVMLPAVAPLVNIIGPLVVTKFCVNAEMLLIPAALSVNAKVDGVIVKALAFGLKKMVTTSVAAESEIAVVPDKSNVAVSPELLGTVMGVQLAAVFQSPEPGANFHVALPAKAGAVRRSENKTAVSFGSL
jgi:hypothetical protein